MDRRLRVLILEDVPADAELELRELEKAGLRFEHRVVQTRDEFLIAIGQFAPDIILSDFSLPQFDGLSALALVLDRAPHIPFVMVTGAMTEETAVECMKAGAADYVLKEHLGPLGPAVRRALDTARLERERSETQRALLASEDRLRLALAAAQMGVWEWDILTNAVFWSPECLEVLGAHELDATMDSFTRLLHPEDAQRVWDAITRSHRERSSFAAEFRIVRPDGSVRWMSILARTAFDPSGKPVRMVGVIEDVTSRRDEEEALRVSEQNYRTVFEEANDAMVVYEPDSEEILDVNARACEAYGYSRDELVGMSLKRLTKHVEQGEASIKQLLEEGSVRDFESVHLSRDGREINVLVNSSLIEYRGGKAVLDINRDITQRKRAEETLRDSEERYRTLVAHSPDGVFLVDLGGSFLSVNEAICSGLGFSEPELLSMNIWDVVPRQYKDFHEARLARILQGESIEDTTEYEVRTKGGDTRLLEIRSAPFRKKGKIVGFQGIARDITERKRAEDALRESEAQIKAAFASSPIGMALVAPDGRWLEVNPALCQIVGYSEEELLAKTFQDITHPDDLDSDLAYVRQMLTGEIPTYQMEKRYLQKQGQVVWVLLNVSLVRDDAGQPLYFVSQIQDITEAKLAAQALRESEERYRQLFTSAIDGIAVADAQTGILTDCNQALCSMVGRTRDQLIGQSQAILHPPDPLIDGVTADFARSRGGLLGKTIETKLLARDGTLRDVEIRANLVDRGGRPHMVGVFRDLTERKKLEREVVLRQHRLDSFFQGASAGLGLYDEELRFVQVNDTLAAMGGVPAHEYLGRTMLEVVPKLAPVVEPLLRRVLATGEPVLDVEVSGQTQSQPGVERQWLTSFFPIAGLTGKPQGVGVIVVEVTERKHLEAQLRQAQKMEAIGRLAGGVAHDFNNILQAMLSNTALLQLHVRGAGAGAEPLKELDQLVRRASSLTQQLLLFSRQQPAVRVPLELKDAVHGVATLLRRVVRENVAITSELADSPLPVLADRGQLEQVLLNLAVNASDAMPTGGKVTLRAGADGDHVFLSVSDTGQGITEEVRAHLFEPFFTTKAPGKGTGLGLSVVHGIVTAHGGRTEVTSAPGEGATFTVWLPRAEAPLGKLADLTKRPSDIPVGGNEHILVVEDEYGVRKSLLGILRSLGYTVTAAATGEEAVAQPPEPAPDLLLTDVVLPGITGAAVVERLRDRWPALKVVMMSGYLENEAIRDLAASGRVRFLQKPFDMRALALAIRQTLDEEAPRPLTHT